MPHLPPERLAALVNEPATPDEQSLLAASAATRAELEAMRRLVELAGAERERVGPPLTTWESLSQHLRADGTIGGGVGRTVTDIAPARRSRPALAWALRAAAALVLVAGGVVGGRVSAGGSALPSFASGASTPSDGELTATPVANTAPDFASREDAATALEQAERTYRLAAAFLAEHDSTDAAGGTRDVAQVKTRLAALEEMVATSRAALYAAPQDPVINQYYLATLGAREATLKQLSNAQPVAVRVAY